MVDKVGDKNVYVLGWISVNVDMYYMRLIREIVGGYESVTGLYMHYIYCVM